MAPFSACTREEELTTSYPYLSVCMGKLQHSPSYRETMPRLLTLAALALLLPCLALSAAPAKKPAAKDEEESAYARFHHHYPNRTHEAVAALDMTALSGRWYEMYANFVSD